MPVLLGLGGVLVMPGGYFMSLEGTLTPGVASSIAFIKAAWSFQMRFEMTRKHARLGKGGC